MLKPGEALSVRSVMASSYPAAMASSYPAVNPDVCELIQTRATEVAENGKYVGWFEWLVWAVTHRRRVHMMMGIDGRLVDIVDVFGNSGINPSGNESPSHATSSYGIQPSGNEFIVAAVKYIGDDTYLMVPPEEVNHYCLLRQVSGFTADAPTDALLSSNDADKVARRHGYTMERTVLDGNCAFDCMCALMGRDRTSSAIDELRAVLAVRVHEVKHSPSWQQAFVTCQEAPASGEVVSVDDDGDKRGPPPLVGDSDEEDNEKEDELDSDEEDDESDVSATCASDWFASSPSGVDDELSVANQLAHLEATLGQPSGDSCVAQRLLTEFEVVAPTFQPDVGTAELIAADLQHDLATDAISEPLSDACAAVQTTTSSAPLVKLSSSLADDDEYKCISSTPALGQLSSDATLSSICAAVDQPSCGPDADENIAASHPSGTSASTTIAVTTTDAPSGQIVSDVAKCETAVMAPSGAQPIKIKGSGSHATYNLKRRLEVSEQFDRWRATDAGKASKSHLVDFLVQVHNEQQPVPKKRRMWLSRTLEYSRKHKSGVRRVNLKAANSSQVAAKHLVRNRVSQGRPIKCPVLSEMLWDWFVDIRASVAGCLPPKIVLLQAKVFAEHIKKAGKKRNVPVDMPGYVTYVWKRRIA